LSRALLVAERRYRHDEAAGLTPSGTSQPPILALRRGDGRDRPQRKGHSSEATKGEADRPRILLVDDERDITDALRIGLEKRRYDVQVYNDPTKALAKFKPGAYDLAVIDVRMPRMNGFDLFRELRSLDKSLRICFFTAFEAQAEEFERRFPGRSGVAFLAKPMSLAQFAQNIEKILAD